MSKSSSKWVPKKMCHVNVKSLFPSLALSRSNFMMNFLSFEFGWREIRLLKISLNAKQIKHVSQKQIMQIIWSNVPENQMLTIQSG